MKLNFLCQEVKFFSFCFNDTYYKKIIESIETKEMKNYEGKIWHLYRKLNKIPLNQHVIIKESEMVGDIVVDYTFDVDSLQQYHDTYNYVEILKQNMNEI